MRLTDSSWNDSWMWKVKRKNRELWIDIVVEEYIKREATTLSREELRQWFELPSLSQEDF